MARRPNKHRRRLLRRVVTGGAVGIAATTLIGSGLGSEELPRVTLVPEAQAHVAQAFEQHHDPPPFDSPRVEVGNYPQGSAGVGSGVHPSGGGPRVRFTFG